MNQSGTIRIRVPASTSNCGPGFDTLGIALNLYNHVEFTPADDAEIRFHGVEGTAHEPGLAMVREAANAYFNRTKVSPFGFHFRITGNVPHARGLGSSVTLRAGVLAALNAVSGGELTRQEIVSVVAALEGHPDNAAAAVLGGFCVARMCPDTGRFIDAVHIDVAPSLSFVVASPEQKILTSKSRTTLPQNLPFFDVVKSLNSLAYIVSVFALQDYEKLRRGVTDFLHEPTRFPAIEGAREAIEAGMEAGAYTGWLSGSGSSVLCVAPAEVSEAVGREMERVFREVGTDCNIYPLKADNEGVVELV